MNKYRYLILPLTAILAFLSGCSKQNVSTPKVNGTALYYINSEKTGIVAKSYTIDQANPEDAVKQMVKKMSKKSTDVEYNPAIPDGVKVKSCVLSDGEVTIDFSSEYGELSSIIQVLSRAAVVDSLVQIDGVKQVSFLQEGEAILGRDGSPIGAMDADSFVQDVGSTLNSYQTTTLHLYFANEAGDKLHMETRDVKYNSNVSLEKLIMEQLIKGPSGLGNYGTVDPDTIILGVTIRDGICYVNLDTAFLENEFDVRPEITVYSIVNSLIDGNDISSVQISINGETNVKYMDTVDLSQPLTAENSYVEQE